MRLSALTKIIACEDEEYFPVLVALKEAVREVIGWVRTFEGAPDRHAQVGGIKDSARDINLVGTIEQVRRHMREKRRAD